MSANSTGERAFHVRPEAVDLVLSGLVQHVLVSLPANWVQAVGIRPNVSDRFGPKRLWVGRLRHLRLLVRAEALRQATVATHVRLRLSQKVQEAANGSGAQGIGGSTADGMDEKDQKACLELTVRLVELDNKILEKVARAICALQRAFRQAKRSKLPKRKRQETPEEADAAAMHMFETAFPGVPAKGFVIYLCGSTGIVGDSFRYLRMLAGMGFVVLAPDMLVSAAVMGSTLKTRQPKASMLLDSANSEYWGKASLYAENSSCTGEMIYCSNADSFLSSPEEFNRTYSNIITLRQAELAHILRRIPSIMRRQGVTLIGSSEGGVVLSCFQDEHFLDIINSRVILAYPCELNYWTYFRPEDVGIVGDASIPTLNLVGCDDQYFGRTNSVASKVAEVSDLPAVHGHAFETMVSKGIKHGLVCHFEGAVHTLLHTHDSVVREVLADFLQRPHHTCLKLPIHWEKIPHLRSLIRRYRSHREPSCKVQYVRFCAPRSEQIMETLKEENVELLERVDRVIYQYGKGKTSNKASGNGSGPGAPAGGAAPLTMERVASIITALHTSTEGPVHTCVSLAEKLPDFVEKVEEQLEEILHEEAKQSPVPEEPTKANGSVEPASNGASLDPTPTQTPSKPSSVVSEAPPDTASVSHGGVKMIRRGVANTSTTGAAKPRTKEPTYSPPSPPSKVPEPQPELQAPSAARAEAKYPSQPRLVAPSEIVAGGEVTASAMLKSAEVVAAAVGDYAQSLRQAGLCVAGGAVCLSMAIAMLRFGGSRNS